MLAISQKPDRVLNILRSSTPMIVRRGIGSYVARSRAGDRLDRRVVVGARVAVLMLLLLA